MRLASRPTDEGGPGKEEAYWLKQKLGASIRHLRDIEDYYRERGGLPDSPNMDRADRARSLYEQISDDFLNGRHSVPTMRQRAETAEAQVAAQQAVIDRAEDILRKAQAPRRPDGTYNYSREAFEQMANDYFAAVASTGKGE